jgi:hypothetical protein
MLNATGSCVYGRHFLCSGYARDLFTLNKPWPCTCPCHEKTS